MKRKKESGEAFLGFIIGLAVLMLVSGLSANKADGEQGVQQTEQSSYEK